MSITWMLKTYQRGTNLFEFSQDTYREEFEIRIRPPFALTLLSNGYVVAFIKAVCKYFKNKYI